MQKDQVDTLLADARETYGVFGKAQRALELVDRALALAPANVEAINLKAAILYEMDRDDDAQAMHQQALAIEPNSVEALHGLAAIANDEGKFADAVHLTAQALQSVPLDPYPEFQENEDYRQRLVAEVYNERAFAFWYLKKRDEAYRILNEEGPEQCPLEIESFEEQLDWLEHHPESPEE